MPALTLCHQAPSGHLLCDNRWMGASQHRGGEGDVAGFAERLLAVIDEGRRTATYKLALLLALMEACIENSSEHGEAPSSLSTRQIASYVAALYWPQLEQFPTATGSIDLRQITNKSSAILHALGALREVTGPVTTWETAAAMCPQEAGPSLDVVELTVARYPLVHLQVINGVERPFIYDLEWGESVTLAQLHRDGGGEVRLRPGAGGQLIRLAPLVRPLAELHWVRMVAALNGLTVEEEELRRHLFGAARASFPLNVRRGLPAAQDRPCFYCNEHSPAAKYAIDHFIPWSRWPNDALENLVISHVSCNSAKSAHLPGPVPLSRWAERLRTRRREIDDLAIRTDWHSRRATTVALARSVFAHLPDGTPLWNGPRQIVESDRARTMKPLEGL